MITFSTRKLCLFHNYFNFMERCSQFYLNFSQSFFNDLQQHIPRSNTALKSVYLTQFYWPNSTKQNKTKKTLKMVLFKGTPDTNPKRLCFVFNTKQTNQPPYTEFKILKLVFFFNCLNDFKVMLLERTRLQLLKSIQVNIAIPIYSFRWFSPEHLTLNKHIGNATVQEGIR